MFLSIVLFWQEKLCCEGFRSTRTDWFIVGPGHAFQLQSSCGAVCMFREEDPICQKARDRPKLYIFPNMPSLFFLTPLSHSDIWSLELKDFHSLD